MKEDYKPKVSYNKTSARIYMIGRPMKYERSLPERWMPPSLPVERAGEAEGFEQVLDKFAQRAAGYNDLYAIKMFVRPGANLSVLEIPEVVQSFTEFLMSPIARSSPQNCILALQIVKAVWYLIPKGEDMDYSWLNFGLAEAVFDCLHSTEDDICLTALECLNNLASIRHVTHQYMICKEIFQFLSNYLMMKERYDDIAPAISLMQTLVEGGVDDDLYFIMRHTIPVFQHRLLKADHPEIVKHVIRTLIPFLENEKGLQYCASLGLHSTVAKCLRSKIDPEFGYYAFRAVLLFLERQYLRIFACSDVFSSATAFLVFDPHRDVSPVLFAIAIIASKYWRELYECSLHEQAKRFLIEGIFENKLASALFLLNLIRNSHPQIKDQLANTDYFDEFCNLLECYKENEIYLFCEAMLQLLDLNFVLYSTRLKQCLSYHDLHDLMGNFDPNSESTKLIAILLGRLTEDQ